MTNHISQCIVFSCITFLHLLFITIAQSDNYIIHMDKAAMPKVFTTHHTWYLSTLSSALENPQLTTSSNNLNSLFSSKLIYTYTHVMNGFSANLSPKEHESLKTSPGYISSIKDSHMKLDTTHSPQFLGLNPNKGAWHDSNFGNDVIVGLIDTGIWPESESFKDNLMSEIPSKWNGQCENSILFNSSLCNKKLIGAKFFNKGLQSKYPNITLGLNSTRDSHGHGTHTSSTAAGNRVDDASFFGYAPGTASGIASNSRVAMYKAIWDVGVLSSDVIAAIDAAISDGVDVLSLSFGINDVPLYDDPVAIATFAAMEKGVFVSTSAGNNGPALETLHNGTPWVITVAAGTMDREFQGTLTLGNGNTITGLSRYIGTFSSNNVPIVFMGLCDNVKELKKVKNKIVVCEDKDGASLFYQVDNLDEAKVLGAVFITNVTNIYFSENSFASIIVDPINGEVVKAYIKSYNSKNSTSKASMSFMKTVFGIKPAPSVSSYSSRGPSNSCPYILKPDITAPGTNILAAWPTNVPVMGLGTHKIFNKFNVISGTSMACPHVAGVAALLKGAHGDWSPAAIRSAIMTTSDIIDNTKEHIKDIGNDNKAATPFALGAGHVNPNRALDPGLIYDVGVQDYVNLLCALSYSQKNITAITRSSSNDCSEPSLDLNYPSFIAFFDNGNSSSRTTQEFHRTITNVGEGETVYVSSITQVEGFHVSVIPNKLVFNEKNEKLSYKLRIEVARTTKMKKVAFGYLTWMDTKHVVRSPIVVAILG
ncbi:putative tripeptidyl-peptidase II [Medicago truncatula]|uniref:Putative tripeptidyl-peptidase II n=1 Tax=Medicago truncatula TaxID=3880 RepID=A0A072TYE4_MEDTR|nr:subtilisin-like protease SBT3 [Medicago truncatula]KEH18575.1 subtilisin-like serine protease [Medicago truncatula]RHN39637.1 putative tripeptidyl-peptidase II [Medicago truncatula]